MEQTKVEPVIECFVSHGPINQLSFSMYYKKVHHQNDRWLTSKSNKTNKWIIQVNLHYDELLNIFKSSKTSNIFQSSLNRRLLMLLRFVEPFLTQ